MAIHGNGSKVLISNGPRTVAILCQFYVSICQHEGLVEELLKRRGCFSFGRKHVFFCQAITILYNGFEKALNNHTGSRWDPMPFGHSGPSNYDIFRIFQDFKLQLRWFWGVDVGCKRLFYREDPVWLPSASRSATWRKDPPARHGTFWVSA